MTAEELRDELAKHDFDFELLDDLVHDCMAEKASAINNDGIVAQLEFLMGEGWDDPKSFMKRFHELLAENP